MSESPWRDALGEQVHEARLARGWTWGAVDSRTSVPATTWRRVEQGRPCGDHALIGIADALGWDRGECFRILADAVEKDAAG